MTTSLVVRLCAGKESLARHLAHEETEAIALIQQHMTDAEWRQLEEQEFKKGVRPSTVIRLRQRYSFSTYVGP